MADAIIEELWKIKDDIAREHGYDIRRLGAYLRSLEGRTVEDYLRELKTETPAATFSRHRRKHERAPKRIMQSWAL